MKKIIVLFFVVAMLMMATSAMAAPITGEINFGGALTLDNTNFLTSTTINFADPSWVVDTVSGTYAVIPSIPSDFPLMTFATFTDFTYTPSMVPVTPFVLWTLTYNGVIYDFDLSQITNITATQITGTGVLGVSGGIYEDTPGVWKLTTQDNGTSTISFSSTSSAVPEPGTLLLLGTGIASLAFFARRRRN